MSIALTDIPIPSTATFNEVPHFRRTPKEVRTARARDAGQTIVACPLCGEQARPPALRSHPRAT